MAKIKRRRFHRPERDRAIHQVLQGVRDLTAGQIADKCFVSSSTVRNWRSGKTLYPRHVTLAAVAAIAGLEFRLMPKEKTARNGADREERRYAGLSH